MQEEARKETKILHSLLSLSTLSMFVPKKFEMNMVDDNESNLRGSRSSIGGRVRKIRDWNMFLFAICVFLSSFGVVSSNRINNCHQIAQSFLLGGRLVYL